MRLDKYLCDLDIGSRSQVKEIIKKKRVTVDREVATNPAMALADTSKVYLDGELLTYEEFRYFMLNKPQGVVSATEDGKEKTVMELLGNENIKGMFPVGRLDKDTEGLLLITNDGKLAHNLLSPKKHVEKCYYVELLEDIKSEDIKQLESGVDIGDDTVTLPARVEAINKKTIYLTITEGRYHQVKRMLEAVNNKVVFLKRVSFGTLTLDEELKTGEYRRLYADELIMLSLK